jgi:penicillin-binding protein 2
MTTSASSQSQKNRDLHLLWIFKVGILSVFIALLIVFWNFQASQYRRFSEMAENNHRRTLLLRSPRGVVFDRDGQLLIENRYSLNISLIPEQVVDLDRTVNLLSDVTGLSFDEINNILKENSDAPSYSSILVIKDASLSQVASVKARAVELAGIVVEPIPARYYPQGSLASHLFGHIGEITETQLKESTDRRLRAGLVVGQSGIEHFYNPLLMGKDGIREVVVNSIGREIEIINEVPPQEGQQLRLTIDYDLQHAVEEAFNRESFSGAAVVLNPNSGEVLALASFPSYDPNDFALGIEQDTWVSLSEDDLKPLQNRALQGLYPPGSTFKIVIAAAALETGLVQPDFRVTCNGGANFYGRFYNCPTNHGRVAMDEAIEKSCNTYFYTLGSMLDIDVINKYAGLFGLGELSQVDLPYEVKGLVPSRAWKQESIGEPWYPGETISVAIGQGLLSVTPLSLAVMMATVANGGTRVVPHLLKSRLVDETWVPIDWPNQNSIPSFQTKTIETLRRGLWQVVNRRGTGGLGRIQGRDVIGKTGTAQVISLAGREIAGETTQDLRAHGWFVFAAPMDNPQIAGVIFAEHAEHGYLAVPIAKHVLETFFAKQEGSQAQTFQLLESLGNNQRVVMTRQ